MSNKVKSRGSSNFSKSSKLSRSRSQSAKRKMDAVENVYENNAIVPEEKLNTIVTTQSKQSNQRMSKMRNIKSEINALMTQIDQRQLHKKIFEGAETDPEPKRE